MCCFSFLWDENRLSDGDGTASPFSPIKNTYYCFYSDLCPLFVLQSSSSPATLKLLAFLMDWILDSQMFTSRAGNERQGVDRRRPPVAAFGERCVKVAYSPWLHFDSLLFYVIDGTVSLQVLPLLADQLHHAPVSQPELFLNLLRLIDGTLRHIDHNALVNTFYWLLI